MFEEANKLLMAEQAERVRQVLSEFADVFATRDLGIGGFTALMHYLKMGQAFPIKQSMRRSPLGFEKQEKATLKQMLAARLIEHSHSEWASPPVLVRKKKWILEVLHWFQSRQQFLQKRCISSSVDWGMSGQFSRKRVVLYFGYEFWVLANPDRRGG